MPGKKILMLVGEFSEEYEIFVFEQAMHAVGHTVHVVCPGKEAGDVIKTSLHDFEGHQTYTEKLGHDYFVNKTFAEVNPALSFDRAAARGCRLALPAGTSVRFEPGIDREVELVAITGRRVVAGLRGEVGGPLDEAVTP